MIQPNINFKIQKYYYDYNKDILNDNKMTFKIFINELKKEINKISDELDRFNFYNISYLNVINQYIFFVSIIKMYTEEGFLYKFITLCRMADKFLTSHLYSISFINTFMIS